MERGTKRTIQIDLAAQCLDLCEGNVVLRSYAVSTPRNGAGERDDSECTPRGAHAIEDKIGGGAAPGTVFVGREPTGEICTLELFEASPERDWILTRVLTLGGLEPGRNQGGNVDTRRGTSTSTAARRPSRWESPAPTAAFGCETTT